MRKLKIITCLMWLFSFIVVVFSSQHSPLTDVRATVATVAMVDEKVKSDARPKLELIDRFDRVIQQRFLTAPNFGIRRMGTPPNPHFESFVPQTPEEQASVAGLESSEWKVGLYLFGRRVSEKIFFKNGTSTKGLSEDYRINPPLPVTKGLKAHDMVKPRNLMKQVRLAFDALQKQNSYEFSMGQWSYVARPVRANASCLKCHTDFIITSKTAKQTYNYRPRQAGDTIGVLVYSFKKSK